MTSCGAVNRYGALTLMCECLAHGSGTIRRCGLVGVGVALLEEVCYQSPSAQAPSRIEHRR